MAQPQIVVGKSADRQQVCKPRAGASSELRPGRELGERERERKQKPKCSLVRAGTGTMTIYSFLPVYVYVQETVT